MDIVLNGIIPQLTRLILNPFLYIGIIIIILLYRKQISFERKLFSARIHSLSQEVIKSIIYGFSGGIIASLLMLLLGVTFDIKLAWLIWSIATILVLFNIRFICLSYSIGVIGIISSIIQIFERPIILQTNNFNNDWLINTIQFLANINIASLIVIVATLHLVEAILVKLNSAQSATPIFLQSKRGRIIGGYNLQSYWLLPLFLLVPIGNHNDILFTLYWWPLSFENLNLLIVPIPVMIGYSDLTTVYTPEEKTKKSFVYLLIYSLVLILFALITKYFSMFSIFAALFALIGHEAIRIIGRKNEEKYPPRFVHSKDGVMILSVLPDSLAEKMELKNGEVIKKVNGINVANKQDLYDALQKQSAFVKLEIINLDGQLRFAQHSIYAGEHHQLGIILAPDDDAPYYLEVTNINLFKILSQKVKKISKEL